MRRSAGVGWNWGPTATCHSELRCRLLWRNSAKRTDFPGLKNLLVAPAGPRKAIDVHAPALDVQHSVLTLRFRSRAWGRTMKFHLIFDGNLPPRGKAASLERIHDVRMAIHPQMKAMWSVAPLNTNVQWLRPNHGLGPDQPYPGVLERRLKWEFVPLISRAVGLLAEIHVTVLRDRHPNSHQGIHGDIDNRVKTLFDALRVPTLGECNKLVDNVTMPDRTFCLLQDDDLISKLTVETDRWLGVEPHRTLAIIQVSIKASQVSLDNLDLLT